MSFQAVLWDMDGTLIDSECLYDVSLTRTNQKYKLDMNLDDTHGTCLSELWTRIPVNQQSNVNYNDWVEEIQGYVVDHIHQLPLFTPARQIVEMVRQQNLFQSCVSNNRKKFIESVIRHNQVESYFHHWLGREDVEFCKPHPAPYLHSAQLLGVKPANCLVIEDSWVGVQSAQAAGMKVALYDPKNLNQLRIQADYPIRCHSELLHLIAA